MRSSLLTRWRNLRYHFQNTPWHTLRDYQQQLHHTQRLPWWDLVHSAWVHGASPLDYYCLRFFEKGTQERQRYLTTSRIFALRQATQETPAKTLVLRDKLLFNETFRPLLGRQFWSWETLRSAQVIPSPLVIKKRYGQGGEAIHILSDFHNPQDCLRKIERLLEHPRQYVYESHLVQHPDLQRLYPHAVNSLKVLTCYHQGQVSIWGTVLSIATQPHLDNFSQKGLTLALSPQGIAQGTARYRDPHRPPESHHPLTRIAFAGFQVPFFQAALALCQETALRLPDIATISWDVAILPQGPCLIEGNHNWNAHILQIPMEQGMAPLARALAPLTPYG